MRNVSICDLSLVYRGALLVKIAPDVPSRIYYIGSQRGTTERRTGKEVRCCQPGVGSLPLVPQESSLYTTAPQPRRKSIIQEGISAFTNAIKKGAMPEVYKEAASKRNAASSYVYRCLPKRV
jgi:hypothetical protein